MQLIDLIGEHDELCGARFSPFLLWLLSLFSEVLLFFFWDTVMRAIANIIPSRNRGNQWGDMTKAKASPRSVSEIRCAWLATRPCWTINALFELFWRAVVRQFEP